MTTVSSCSCGGKGCALCYTSAFVRPNFFAGQLLTEDDLQKLGEYVVAKNRLHNRFLFGEGVVCGLEVTCDPCGKGVTVHPGYALDCCGNDLTLACKTTLDINTMVRELRRSAGTDCGDPCAEAKPVKPKDDPSMIPVKGQDAVVEESVTRHYCLYLRYCEDRTDPVAPYSTGEPCGASACETTRIREGVSFELRCRKEEKPRHDIYTRLKGCFEDLDKINWFARSIGYHDYLSGRSRHALNSINANPVPAYDAAHIRQTEMATNALNDAMSKLAKATPSASAMKRLKTVEATESPSAAAKPAEAELRDAFDALLDAESVVARFYARDAAAQKKNLGEGQFKEAQARVSSAQEAIKSASETLEKYPVNEIFTHQLESESAYALIDLSKKLGGRPSSDDFELRMLSDGAVFTQRLAYASARSQASLRDWLYERLDNSPNLTDCELRRDLDRATLPEAASSPKEIRPLKYGDASMMTKSSETLKSVFMRYLRDCMCAAINPACVPCDDQAVLLACLEIEECEVVKVCSLERTFVLSPAAMRYWLPPLSLLGDGLEYLCCTDIEELGRSFKGLRHYFRSQSPSLDGTASFGEAAGAVVSAVGSRMSRFSETKIDPVMRSVMGLFREDQTPWTMISGRPFRSFGRTETVDAGRVEQPSASAAAAATVAGFDLSGDLGRIVMDKLTPIIDKQVEVKLAQIRKDEAAAAKKAAKDKDKKPPTPEG